MRLTKRTAVELGQLLERSEGDPAGVVREVEKLLGDPRSYVLANGDGAELLDSPALTSFSFRIETYISFERLEKLLQALIELRDPALVDADAWNISLSSRSTGEYLETSESTAPES